MILHPITSPGGVLGLLSFFILCTTTSLAAPVSSDSHTGQLGKRETLLIGGVFTDYYFGGLQQILTPGCNNFVPTTASQVSSYNVIHGRGCRFYKVNDCQTGFLWEATGRSDATLKGNDNKAAQSAFCF